MRGRAQPEAAVVLVALGRRQRGDEGVAERDQGPALAIVEQLAVGQGRERLADREAGLGVVGEVVGVARRRVPGGHHQRLATGVLADPVGAVARAEPGLLPAAHRQLERRVVELRVVDHRRPRLDPARELLAAPLVAGPDRGLQAVAAVVGELDRLVRIADPHHRQGRAEGLLGHAEHRVIDVGEHGRLEVTPRPLAARAPGDRGRALVERVADVGLDQLQLRREDDRADVDGSRLAGRPLAQAADLLGQPLEELVVDRLLDVDPFDRDADLARVVEPVGGGGVGGALEVGVGEHDHRVLAAELEAHRGERLRGLRHHLLPGRDRAGEHDEVDLVDQRRAGLAAAGGDLKDALGDPALGEHLGHQQRGQRGHLGRLHDHGVAGGERRDAVAEGVVERVVPGADHADDAERLVADHHPAAAHERRRRLDLLVGEVGGRLPGPELERREPVGELGELGLVGRAAGLGADRRHHPLGVRDQPAARREQDLGAPLEPELRPAGLRRAGRGDDRPHLVRAELGDARDRLPRRRVLDLDSRLRVASALPPSRIEPSLFARRRPATRTEPAGRAGTTSVPARRSQNPRRSSRVSTPSNPSPNGISARISPNSRRRARRIPSRGDPSWSSIRIESRRMPGVWPAVAQKVSRYRRPEEDPRADAEDDPGGRDPARVAQRGGDQAE